MPLKSTFPLIDMPKCNILSYLFPPNEEPSDSPIWIDSGNLEEYLTLRQALQWVKKLAIGLNRLEIERGQPVLIFAPNHIFVPIAYLAIAGSGRIFSGANPGYTAPELVHQIRDTEASLLLVHPDLLPTALAAAKTAGLSKEQVFLFSDRPNPSIDGVHDWRTVLGSDEESAEYTWDHLEGESAKDTIATINYSSGTTGLPKGVCVSHYNLCANCEQTRTARYALKDHSEGDRPHEIWAGFLPLYHAFGQLYIILMAAKLGFPVYVMKTFVFEDFLRVIETHRITHLQVAPPIVVLLAKRPETARYDLSSLVNIACGAAPLSGGLQNEVAKKLNIHVVQGWGMTELTCGSIISPQGFIDRTGSVGLLMPNNECKLLDDDGNEVSPGQAGELFIRGPNVCLGYWKNETATKTTISLEGWLRTGDVAVAQHDRFWIVDRKKELIKVRGFQVAPAELEAILLENADVADAAVVAVLLHEEECPRAYVLLKEQARGKTTAEDIRAWMQRRVAKHKQLSGGISFVDEVPKSPSGKILRKVLRDWAKRDVPKLQSQMRARL